MSHFNRVLQRYDSCGLTGNYEAKNIGDHLRYNVTGVHWEKGNYEMGSSNDFFGSVEQGL
jgi:hypothetical protein